MPRAVPCVCVEGPEELQEIQAFHDSDIRQQKCNDNGGDVSEKELTILKEGKRFEAAARNSAAVAIKKAAKAESEAAVAIDRRERRLIKEKEMLERRLREERK